MVKINTETISLIMGLTATMSSRKIAEQLNNQGIKLSYVTIGKIINEQRKERAEQTKETVNEHIKHTLTTDLDILQNMRDEIYNMFQDHNLRPSERLMCADRVNKVIDTRLKYSGASEGGANGNISVSFNIPRPE